MKKKPNSRLRPKLDPAGEGYPMPMRGLLALGKPRENTSYAAWADSLRDYVPQLIQMVLDPDLNKRDERDKAVWAPIHALGVLTELAAPAAVEPLLEMLEWDDDWTGERLIALYGAVGAAAVQPLHAYALDTEHSVPARTLALAGLAEIAKQHPDQQDEVVARLAGFLQRPGADARDEEDLTAWAISELAQLRATEALPAIRRAFDEDRVNTTIISMEDVQRNLNAASEGEEEDSAVEADPDAGPEDRPLALTLKCQACGREREYTFERAYYDLGTARKGGDAKDSPLIIPEQVVCSKCGAVDQYELGGLSQFGILAKLLAERTGKPDPLPKLELVNFTTARWGWIPPRQVLPRYESEVAAHPDDIELRMGYANALRRMGYRERAAEEYERVLLAAPNHGDALFALAQMQAKHGSIPDAIEMWQAIERRFDQLSLPAEEREMRRQEIVDTLAELRSGVRPDYHSITIPIDEAAPRSLPPALGPRPLNPALSPGPDFDDEPQRPAPAPFGKVGRNERCPCGSGKKYKQCHGRK